MAEIRRTVSHHARASIVMFGPPENVEDSVDPLEQMLKSKCIGTCGLRAACRMVPNKIPEESLEYQLFGQREDGEVLYIDVTCDSAACEKEGIMPQAVEAFESLEDGSAVVLNFPARATEI